MSFKNLEQRFNEKVNDLYRASNQKFDDGKKSNGRFDQPFITRRPGVGYLSGFDSRATPISSGPQDIRRISLFSLSGNGLLFLAKQQLLQTGNAFEITRIINPLFVVGATTAAAAANLFRVRRHARPLSGLLTKTDPYTAQNRWKVGMLQQSSYDSLPRNPSPSFIRNFLNSAVAPLKNSVSAFTAKSNVGESYEWRYSRPELKRNGYILTSQLNDTKFNTSRFDIRQQKYRPTESSPKYAFNRSLDRPSLSSTARLTTIENTLYKTKEISKFPEVLQNNNTTKDIIQRIVSDQSVSYNPQSSTPYIKYFEGGIGSIRGSSKTEVDDRITRVSNQNARDIAAAAKQTGTTKISYIKDPSNLPKTNQQNVRSLASYNTLPMIQNEQTSSFDDAIVVSFAIGNDSPVQFRAFIKDIDESVSPEYKTYQYIGRTEKFITYLSVQREVSFKLSVIAFSRNELETVWKRINFLTGLAYPYGFNRGIMQPNIVKMTIGNLYQNQPGYLTSISTNFNEVMESWDIDEQVPMGATVSLKFVLIEKKTKIAGSPFYAINEANRDFTNDLIPQPITQQRT